MDSSVSRLRVFIYVAIFITNSLAKVESREQQSNASLLIMGIVNAYGGANKIESYIKSHKNYEGVIETRHRVFNSICEEENDKFVDSNIDGPNHFSAGYDGEVFWEATQGFVEIHSQTEMTQDLCFQRNRLFPILHTLITNPQEFESRGYETIFRGDKNFSCLALRARNANLAMWIDPSTFLILRTKSTCNPALADQSQVTVIRDYNDYSGFAGTMFPNREIRSIDGEETFYRWKSHIVIDAVASKGTFSAPSETVPSLIEIPFKLEHEQIVVEGYVNGIKASFMIDTGANFSALSKELASKAGVLPLNHHAVTTSTLYGRGIAEPALVKDFKIGNECVFGDFPVMIEDGKQLFEVRLGTDVLRKFQVEINFANNKLVLSRKKLSFEKGDVIELSSPLAYTPHLWGELNGTPKLFTIDTGNSVFALLQDDSLPVSKSAQNIVFVGPGARSLAGKKARADLLKFGDLHIRNHEVSLVSSDNAMSTENFLGIKFLESFPGVIFNFPEEKLILRKPYKGQ